MKRGQFWYSDFLIGVLIMIAIGLLFFSTMVKLYDNNYKIEELIKDGTTMSDYFMSSGYLPGQWSNPYNPNGRIGFVDNGRLNVNNLTEFSNLVNLNYGNSKYLLGTYYDYVLYFEDKEDNVIDFQGIEIDDGNGDFIGNEGINSLEDITNLDNDYMIRINRFVYYDEEIIKMVVVLWG